MDEPLSNLDAKLRVQMRAEIARLQNRLGTTTVYVTHDQTEAMTLGDRVVVMLGGVAQQIGTPDELYNRPANLFVAGFIGSPAMNFFPATLTDVGVRLPFGDVTLTTEVHDMLAQHPKPTNVIVGVRPETPRRRRADRHLRADQGADLRCHRRLRGVAGRRQVPALPHRGCRRPGRPARGADRDSGPPENQFVARVSAESAVTSGQIGGIGLRHLQADAVRRGHRGQPVDSARRVTDVLTEVRDRLDRALRCGRYHRRTRFGECHVSRRGLHRGAALRPGSARRA